ncbi:dynamin GTPase [Colletotrichum camelliae]|nr:dynamin GTPase [Colletotrichum camelliae]
MASACLPAQEHIIDLNGDVVLALLDPGAVFAECEPRNDTRVRSPDLWSVAYKALADALKRTAHQGPDRNDSDCIRGSILASNLAAATERKGGIVKKPNSKARRKLRRQALFRSTAGLSARAVNDTESQNPSPENSATAAIDGDSPTVQAQPVHLLEAVTRPVFPSHEEGQARNSPSTVSSVRFLVSSRSLSLASKVFEIQLNGGWKEATIDARDSRHHLEVAGWNADAFLILMNIFHARTKTIPEDISLEMLTRIAVLVDYYGCHEAVEPFAAVWIKALARPVLLRGHRDLVLWLLISLIFRQEELFASTTRTIIMQRLPFPRQDGLCTRFATEIILRHSTGPMEITATIRPGTNYSPEMRETLENYCNIIQDFKALPYVIEEVAALMGIRSFCDSADARSFALDILRIDVRGPVGLHLTIVDLPGLISVESDEQSTEDIDIVHRLVETYMESHRTIILAVVQAGNDAANQPVIRKSRKHDPHGLRTIGIITKPDLINKGTENRIARLANNEDSIKLGLGFFLLKNPSPKELEAGLSTDAISQLETDFFAQPTWQKQLVNPERIGAPRLREYLQELLYTHIEKEIPQVRQEIKQQLVMAETTLRQLGPERSTLQHIRSYLVQVSMRFHQLASDSLNGHYLGADAEFFQRDTRLRALVHKANEEFAQMMRLKGSKRRVVDVVPAGDTDNQSTNGIEPTQIFITRKSLHALVKKKRYVKTRGLELPGNYSHNLLSELFHEQSGPWQKLAQQHVQGVVSLVEGWILQVLEVVIPEDELRQAVTAVCLQSLEEATARSHEELTRLWEDERRQPITYNHYYTDNIQKTRANLQKSAVQSAFQEAIREDWHGKFHVSNNPDDINRAMGALTSRVVVNMDDFACTDALEGMMAYYKGSELVDRRRRDFANDRLQVSRKTFVDNVCRQVIERHILALVPGFFSPTVVSHMSDAEVLKIGSEPDRQRARRAELSSLAERLRDSLSELQNNPPV